MKSITPSMPNDVAQVFAIYPHELKRSLLQIRQWIVQVSSKLALLVPCQTRLIADFKELYPQYEYDKNRALHLNVNQALPEKLIKHFIYLALTYYLKT